MDYSYVFHQFPAIRIYVWCVISYNCMLLCLSLHHYHFHWPGFIYLKPLCATPTFIVEVFTIFYLSLNFNHKSFLIFSFTNVLVLIQHNGTFWALHTRKPPKLDGPRLREISSFILAANEGLSKVRWKQRSWIPRRKEDHIVSFNKKPENLSWDSKYIVVHDVTPTVSHLHASL